MQTTAQAASQELQEGVAVQREPVVTMTQPSAEQSEQQSASGVASAERGVSEAGNSASSEGAQSAESGVRPAVTRRRAVGSGLSISSMMQGEVSATTEEEPSVPSVSEVQYDASSEEKIMAVRDRVVTAILEERPRFVVAFEQMQVEGHTIKVEVPSQTLYEEIMRSQTELLLMVARLAGINGTLDLQVSINEQIKASRPIKLEDRIKFMSEKNPHLLELKHALDLEYE